MSTVSKDAANRKKVRDYLEGLGLTVALVQHRTKRGCRDLWGADFLAKDKVELIFVQVKAARLRANGVAVRDVAGPIKEFRKHGPWPYNRAIRFEVMVCIKGRKQPCTFDVTNEVYAREVSDVD